MKHLSTFLTVFTVAVGLLFVTGCDSGGPGAEGSVSVKLTDSGTKAFSTIKSMHDNKTIASAVVTIEEVQIVPAEDTSDSNADGPNVLSTDNFEVDLKKLQAGIDTFLTNENSKLPTGTYSQIRLITADKVAVTFEDDTTTDVMIASGQQTGIKINFDPVTIESEDDRAEITVDFNVQESLHGSSQGQWVITPVVDASATVTSVETSDTNAN